MNFLEIPKQQVLSDELAYEGSILFESLASNTRTAYQKAIKITLLNGLQFPLDTRVITDWIDRLASGRYDTGNRAIKPRALKVSSIKASLAALSFFQVKVLRHPSFASPLVEAKLKTLSRDQARRPLRQAKPLMKKEISLLINEGTNPKSIRDNALIELGFNGCLRRSELVGITFESLYWLNDGLEITLTATKTAINDSVAIPKNNNGYKALAILIECLKSQGIASGFIFLPVTKRGNFLKGKGLSTQSVNEVIKSRAQKAGIETAMISGHSLRAGCASELATRGVSLPAISRHGRWKSAEMVIRYCRVADQFRDNALNALG